MVYETEIPGSQISPAVCSFDHYIYTTMFTISSPLRLTPRVSFTGNLFIVSSSGFLLSLHLVVVHVVTNHILVSPFSLTKSRHFHCKIDTELSNYPSLLLSIRSITSCLLSMFSCTTIQSPRCASSKTGTHKSRSNPSSLGSGFPSPPGRESPRVSNGMNGVKGYCVRVETGD